MTISNEELNRAISEAREPFASLPAPDPESWHGVLSTQQAWLSISEYGEGDEPKWEPLNWTGSEDASAVLLEEMPEAELTGSREEGKWGCHHNGGHGCEYVWHESRKVAIALAWLAWKGKG